MTVSGARSTHVLDRDRDRSGPFQDSVFLLCGGTLERGVVPVRASQQPLVGPNRSDPRDMTHLVGDDILQRAVGFHLSQVGGVERHDAFGRKERVHPGGGRSQVRRAGLTEDAAGAVDRHTLGQDQQVVDHFPVDDDTRYVADDHLGPPVSGGLERILLSSGQAAEKPHFNLERRLDCGGRSSGPDACVGHIRFDLRRLLLRHGDTSRKNSKITMTRRARSGRWQDGFVSCSDCHCKAAPAE